MAALRAAETRLKPERPDNPRRFYLDFC